MYRRNSGGRRGLGWGRGGRGGRGGDRGGGGDGGGRGGGHLPLCPGERVRCVLVHRIHVDKPAEPLRCLVEPPAPLGDLRQRPQREDVLRVKGQDPTERLDRSRVILLVKETAPVDDVRADVIRVTLKSALA